VNQNGTLLKGDFAADALLGRNRGADNIVGNDGKVYRVDNGGALEFRAQGAKRFHNSGINTQLNYGRYPTFFNASAAECLAV